MEYGSGLSLWWRGALFHRDRGAHHPVADESLARGAGERRSGLMGLVGRSADATASQTDHAGIRRSAQCVDDARTASAGHRDDQQDTVRGGWSRGRAPLPQVRHVDSRRHRPWWIRAVSEMRLDAGASLALLLVCLSTPAAAQRRGQPAVTGGRFAAEVAAGAAALPIGFIGGGI